MTTEDLARSYLEKARVRLAVLDVLMAQAEYRAEDGERARHGARLAVTAAQQVIGAITRQDDAGGAGGQGG